MKTNGSRKYLNFQLIGKKTFIICFLGNFFCKKTLKIILHLGVENFEIRQRPLWSLNTKAQCIPWKRSWCLFYVWISEEKIFCKERREWERRWSDEVTHRDNNIKATRSCFGFVVGFCLVLWRWGERFETLH